MWLEYNARDTPQPYKKTKMESIITTYNQTIHIIPQGNTHDLVFHISDHQKRR